MKNNNRFILSLILIVSFCIPFQCIIDQAKADEPLDEAIYNYLVGCIADNNATIDTSRLDAILNMSENQIRDLFENGLKSFSNQVMVKRNQLKDNFTVIDEKVNETLKEINLANNFSLAIDKIVFPEEFADVQPIKAFVMIDDGDTFFPMAYTVKESFTGGGTWEEYKIKAGGTRDASAQSLTTAIDQHRIDKIYVPLSSYDSGATYTVTAQIWKDSTSFYDGYSGSGGTLKGSSTLVLSGAFAMYWQDFLFSPGILVDPSSNYYIKLTVSGPDNLNWKLNGRGWLDGTDYYPRGKGACHENRGSGYKWYIWDSGKDDFNFMTCEEQVAPNLPSLTYYPGSLDNRTLINFYMSAVDTNGDNVCFSTRYWRIGTFPIPDFGAWSGYVLSGVTYTEYKTLSIPGTYSVSVKAKDATGKISDVKSITITIATANAAPTIPTLIRTLPSGSDYTVYIPYTFGATSTDLDGDQIRYGWDTNNDGTIEEWTTLVNSGTQKTKVITYLTFGWNTLKVKAEDEHGKQSDWATMTFFVYAVKPTVTTEYADVSKTSAVLYGKITKDGGETTGATARFNWGKTSLDSYTAGQGYKITNDLFSDTISSLQRMTLYRFRACAANSLGENYGTTQYILTQPDALIGFTATKTSKTSIYLAWTKGSVCDGAFIQYRVDGGGYIDLGYFSGTDYTHSGLTQGVYEYIAYGYAEDGGEYSDGTTNKPFSDSPITSGSIIIYGAPQVTTNDASDVQDTTTILNGYVNNDGNPSGTGIFNFTYGFTAAYGTTTADQAKNTGDSVSQALNSLSIGRLYHFRIQGRVGDAFGIYYGNGSDKTFLTRPANITSLIVSPVSMTELRLTWTNNAGGDGAYVEYAEGTAPSPWNLGSGTKIEGGDDGRITTPYIHVGLLRNHTYYYKAWAYAEDGGIKSNGSLIYPFSLGGLETNRKTISLPNLTVYDANNITNESASLHGYVTDSGVICTVWFEYGINNLDNVTSNETMTMGNIDANITGLLAGQVYTFRLHGVNEVGDSVTQNKTFGTPPKRPTNLFIPEYGQFLVNLTWTKGVGADFTMIRAAEGYYPTNPSNGRLVYFGTDTSVTDVGFQDYSKVYYRAWGYSSISGLYSEDADQVNTSVIDFEVFLPTYLNAGDYIIAWGKIQSISGQSVEGFIATTSVRNLNDTILVGPAYWNCTDGNYQTAISTHELTAGTYQIGVEFENSIGTKFIFTYRSQLFLSSQADPDQGNQTTAAYIYYTFYDVETGTGLDDNYYKVYISADKNFSAGDRVKGGAIGVLRGGETVSTSKEYYMEIRDFNDNIIPLGFWDNTSVKTYSIGLIHNAYVGFNVTTPEFYADLGVYLNQLRIKNMNSSTVYMSLKRTDGNPGLVVGRFIPPWEESEVFIPDGVYNMTIDYYNNTHPENGSQKRIYPWVYNITIADNQFYWIKGSSLDDVIQIIGDENTWIYYTIFDMNTGTKLEDDFYKIYFSTDANFTEDERIIGGEYNTTRATTVHYKIVDYWNNLIYPWNGSGYANFTASSNQTFLDIGIPFNQFLIKNTNETLVYFRITNGNMSDPVNNTWYNRWVPPFESSELFMRSGIYNVSIEYYYPNNATFIGFENLSNFTIDRDMFFVIQGKNAKVYFNFYNANEGLGLPFETMKIYANGVRLTENYIDWYQGDDMNVTIEDYYNNVIYNDTFTINDEYTFKDVPLLIYSYKISNYKYDYFIVGIKKENSSIWWEKIVCPYETIEFLPSFGNYSIRIYNESYNLAEFNDTINRSKAYTIFDSSTSNELVLIEQSQFNLSLNFTYNREKLNITNEQLANILGQLPYRNQTITSLFEEFRKPHVLEIPKLTYNYSDVLPPISTIYASISLTGNIDVIWYATDNIKNAISETLYYKIENASVWKLWEENLSSTGLLEFNSTMEQLVEGSTYSFKSIGIDESGNLENESRDNVYNIVYVKRAVNESINVNQILTNSLSNYIFIIAVILIFVLIIIVAMIERRKRRPEQISTLEEDQGWPYMPYEGDL